MPFPNEHASRQRDPGDFIRIAQLWAKDGIRALGGPLKSDKSGATVVQTLRFNKKQWTPEAAKKWLADHKYKAGLEQASGEDKAEAACKKKKSKKNEDCSADRAKKVMKKLRKVQAEGGSGSGNFGHAGRPGEVGGSMPGGGGTPADKGAQAAAKEFGGLRASRDISMHPTLMKAIDVAARRAIKGAENYEDVEANVADIMHTDGNVNREVVNATKAMFGKKYKTVGKEAVYDMEDRVARDAEEEIAARAIEYFKARENGSVLVMGTGKKTPATKGATAWVSGRGGKTVFKTQKDAADFVKKQQKSGASPHARPKIKTYYAANLGRRVTVPDNESLQAEGGQGSGNFGHAGRPGEVGGSAPGDGGGGTKTPGEYARDAKAVGNIRMNLAKKIGQARKDSPGTGRVAKLKAMLQQARHASDPAQAGSQIKARISTPNLKGVSTYGVPGKVKTWEPDHAGGEAERALKAVGVDNMKVDTIKLNSDGETVTAIISPKGDISPDDLHRVTGKLVQATVNGFTDKLVFKSVTPTGDNKYRVNFRVRIGHYWNRTGHIRKFSGDPRKPIPPPTRRQVPGVRYETLSQGIKHIFEGGSGSGFFGHSGRPGFVGGSSSDGEVGEKPRLLWGNDAPKGAVGYKAGKGEEEGIFWNAGGQKTAGEFMKGRIAPGKFTDDFLKRYDVVAKTTDVHAEEYHLKDKTTGEQFTVMNPSGYFKSRFQVIPGPPPKRFSFKMIPTKTHVPMPKSQKAQAKLDNELLAKTPAKFKTFVKGLPQYSRNYLNNIPAGRHLNFQLRMMKNHGWNPGSFLNPPEWSVENLREGGEGSGNFGHAGRPGEVGGSSPSGVGGASTKKGTPDQRKHIASITKIFRKSAKLVKSGILTVKDKNAQTRDAVKQIKGNFGYAFKMADVEDYRGEPVRTASDFVGKIRWMQSSGSKSVTPDTYIKTIHENPKAFWAWFADPRDERYGEHNIGIIFPKDGGTFHPFETGDVYYKKYIDPYPYNKETTHEYEKAARDYERLGKSSDFGGMIIYPKTTTTVSQGQKMAARQRQQHAAGHLN